MRGRRLVRIVGSLMAVNVLTALAGLVTGPLQARALGPAGRGDLAAILVPLTLAPQILSLGVGVYAARESARGRNIGELVGSLGAVMLAVGTVGAVAGIPLAAYLADGRDVVQLFLTIVFALLPLTLVGTVVFSMLGGLERWRLLVSLRLFPVLLGLIGVVALYLLDALTVTSAAILALVGGLASTVAPLVIMRGERLRASRRTAAEATRFGLKSWVGGLANLANARLDQLLMIRLVTPAELGFYAVAVTLAGVSNFLTGAVGPPLVTRIAKGDRGIVPRALRVTLSITALGNVALAAATPFLLPLLFGSSFEPAVDMTLVLLVAALPLAGIVVLTSALHADGQPVVPSLAEVATLVVTVIGLALLLDPLGGLGAALVSVVAYSINFGIQLTVVRRSFGGRLRDYLVPSPTDLRWGWQLLRRRTPDEVT